MGDRDLNNQINFDKSSTRLSATLKTVSTQDMLRIERESLEWMFENTPEIASVPVVTDPFTLQVAAYLKPEHAVKYETFLKKQNLDAYTIIVKGSQKTWYQVRISHFPDKNSAKAFGTSLKARKIIDDFYIANYERPQ